MYDMLQKRDLAMARYQAAIAGGTATASAETARKQMKEAYRRIDSPGELSSPRERIVKR